MPSFPVNARAWEFVASTKRRKKAKSAPARKSRGRKVTAAQKESPRKRRVRSVVKRRPRVRSRVVDTTAPRWPGRALYFKCWADEWVFNGIRKTLVNRGWTDLGNLCNPQDVNELEDVAKCNKGHRLPRRCLWWIHEDDARRLKDLPAESMATARHCLATFLGTDAAVTKVAITQQLMGEAFYPEAYVLPEEIKKLKKAMGRSKHTYWIAKPRNDYAGHGIVCYESKQKEFVKLINDKSHKEFVVQSYIPNPLLIGGYKFHFRMYTILTGICEKFEAWMLKDGTALFSTEKYKNTLDTLGNNFDKFIHLTNWSVNYVKGNDRLQEDKDRIGVGCEWPVSKVLKMIKQDRPEFSVEKFWKDMAYICAKTMHVISQWKNVRRHKKINDKHPRFEDFGLDLLMDENFKIWLLEANTQVGLNANAKYFPDPNCKSECKQATGCEKCRNGVNVRYKINNRVMEDVINASLDLMQLDVPQKKIRCLEPLHPIIWKEQHRKSKKGL